MARGSEVEQFIKPEQLTAALKRLSRGAVVTHGRFETSYPGDIRDSEWGVFDLSHRIHVHGTYNHFFPLISSKDISILVTPWHHWPVFFQVLTARIEPGFYYQSFSVLGVLYCHQVSRLTQDGENTRVVMDWYIVSHRLFKWMHHLFNWRLAKLQREQNAEDVPLRDRRTALRRRGIRFSTDAPDFINANDMGDHVILPAADKTVRVPLSSLAEGAIQRIDLGVVEINVRKANGELTVWPGLCPHEGARLDAEHFCGDRISCPWHGRSFGPAVLRGNGDGQMRLLNLVAERDGDDLVIRPAGQSPAD